MFARFLSELKGCRTLPLTAPCTEEGANLYGMDCLDIVVGMAQGDVGKVFDAYTRDRSTPQEDSVYGGGETLTAGAAWEEGGSTFVMFRKPLIGRKSIFNRSRTCTFSWSCI